MMKDTTKIILAFAGFVVVAAAILGYGLYNKMAGRRRTEAKASAARSICAISAGDFSLMPRGDRDTLVERARSLKTAIENDRRAERAPAEALGEWLAGRLPLHEQLNQQEASLRGMQEALTYSFPADPNRQLPAGDAQKLRSAAGEVDSFARNTPPGIDQQVKLADVFRDELHKLQQQAAQVRDLVQSREDAYAKFLDQMAGRLSDKDSRITTQEEGKAGVKEVDKWIRLASPCPEKVAKLAELRAQLVSLAEFRQQEELLGRRLEAVAMALAGGDAGAERGVARAQAQKIVSEAEALNSNKLKRDTEKLKAMLRQAPGDTPGAASGTDKALDGIIVSMARYFLADPPEKPRLRRDIMNEIANLKPLDPAFAGFFEKVLEVQAQSDEVSTRMRVIKDILGDLEKLRLSQEAGAARQAIVDRVEKAIRDLPPAEATLAGNFRVVLAERRRPKAPTKSPPRGIDLSRVDDSIGLLEQNSDTLKKARYDLEYTYGTTWRTAARTVAAEAGKAASNLDQLSLRLQVLREKSKSTGGAAP